MLVSPSRLGGIEEIESGLSWDAAALASELGRRAAQLSGLGIPRASRVAIARGGSADFFADLLAAWSLGGTVICLDPALTPSERGNVLAFAPASPKGCSERRGKARPRCATTRVRSGQAAKGRFWCDPSR